MPLPSAYRRAPLMDPVYCSLPAAQRAPGLTVLRDRLLSMIPQGEGSLPLRVLRAELCDLAEGSLPEMPDLSALPLSAEDPVAFAQVLAAAERLAFYRRDAQAARAVGEAFDRFHQVLPRVPEGRVFACAAPLLRAMLDFYRRSGDRRILELAADMRSRLPDVSGFCHAFPFTEPFTADPALPDDYTARMTRFADGKGLAETFAMCAALAQFTGSERDLTAPAVGLKAALRAHGQPFGGYSAQPSLAGRSPAASADLMSVCALTQALCDALRLTGENEFACRLDRLCANALPELISPGGVRREITADRLSAAPVSAPTEEELIALAAAVQAVRDTHFAMADDRTPTLLLPMSGRCLFRAEGVNVALNVTARGSYRREVTVAVECDQPVNFTLRLRVPSWADGAQLCLNGGSPRMAPTGQYAVVSRTFAPGDTIALQMMLAPRFEEGFHHGQSLFCGETLLAFPLPENTAWKYAFLPDEPVESGRVNGLPCAKAAAVSVPGWERLADLPPEPRAGEEEFTLTFIPSAETEGRLCVLPRAKV